MDQRFREHERLKSRKLIGRIFKEGRLIKAYPVMLFYLQDESLALQRPQVGFSVPAKKLKKAVDRNLMKRRMREVYRLQRDELGVQALENTALMLVYVKPGLTDYEQVQKSLQKGLRTLAERKL